MRASLTQRQREVPRLCFRPVTDGRSARDDIYLFFPFHDFNRPRNHLKRNRRLANQLPIHQNRQPRLRRDRDRPPLQHPYPRMTNVRPLKNPRKRSQKRRPRQPLDHHHIQQPVIHLRVRSDQHPTTVRCRVRHRAEHYRGIHEDAIDLQAKPARLVGS